MALNKRMVVMAAVFVSAGPIFVSQANALKHVISVKASDVSTYVPSADTLGKYYILQFQVPSEIRAADLRSAWIEFYVDASSFARTVGGDSTAAQYINKTPAVQVFALKSSFSGTVDASQFDTGKGRIRPVLAGTSRRVRVEITGIAKSYIENPISNHGLIVGSLAGLREGNFDLRTDILPDGSVATVLLYHWPR